MVHRSYHVRDSKPAPALAHTCESACVGGRPGRPGAWRRPVGGADRAGPWAVGGAALRGSESKGVASHAYPLHIGFGAIRPTMNLSRHSRLTPVLNTVRVRELESSLSHAAGPAPTSPISHVEVTPIERGSAPAGTARRAATSAASARPRAWAVLWQEIGSCAVEHRRPARALALLELDLLHHVLGHLWRADRLRRQRGAPVTRARWRPRDCSPAAPRSSST